MLICTMWMVETVALFKYALAILICSGTEAFNPGQVV